MFVKLFEYLYVLLIYCSFKFRKISSDDFYEKNHNNGYILFILPYIYILKLLLESSFCFIKMSLLKGHIYLFGRIIQNVKSHRTCLLYLG
jgi:hypothetical protein